LDDSPLDTAPAAPEGSTTADGSAPVGPSPADQLASIIQGAVGPIAEASQRQYATLAQRVEQIAAQMAQPAAARPTGATGNQDIIDRFLADPDAVINERAEAVVKRMVAPLAAGLADDNRGRIDRDERARVDSYYGEGVYEREVKPLLDNIVSGMPEHLRFNGKAIHQSVSAILGSEEMRPKLDQARAAKVKAEGEARRKAPPSFIGQPGVATAAREEITADDREVLKAINKAGIASYTEEDMRVTRQLPKGSLEEMAAARAKLRKSGKAA
jgi:hypothetical protein